MNLHGFNYAVQTLYYNTGLKGASVWYQLLSESRSPAAGTFLPTPTHSGLLTDVLWESQSEHLMFEYSSATIWPK